MVIIDSIAECAGQLVIYMPEGFALIGQLDGWTDFFDDLKNQIQATHHLDLVERRVDEQFPSPPVGRARDFSLLHFRN